MTRDQLKRYGELAIARAVKGKTPKGYKIIDDEMYALEQQLPVDEYPVADTEMLQTVEAFLKDAAEWAPDALRDQTAHDAVTFAKALRWHLKQPKPIGIDNDPPKALQYLRDLVTHKQIDAEEAQPYIEEIESWMQPTGTVTATYPHYRITVTSPAPGLWKMAATMHTSPTQQEPATGWEQARLGSADTLEAAVNVCISDLKQDTRVQHPIILLIEDIDALDAASPELSVNRLRRYGKLAVEYYNAGAEEDPENERQRVMAEMKELERGLPKQDSYEENRTRPITRISLTAPALERLLGGNSELEVRLQQQAADQFAYKHLRSLINSDAMKEAAAIVLKAKNDLYTEAQNQIREQIGHVATGWQNGLKLTPVFQAALDQHLKALTDKAKEQLAVLMSRQEIKEAVEAKTAGYSDLIAQQVAIRLDAEVATQIKLGVQRKLDAAVAAVKD